MFRLVKLLYFLISFIFFLQGLEVISVIPVKPVANFLGLNSDPLSIFVAAFYAVFFVFAASAVGEVLYSLGFKREGGIINQKRIFTHGFIAFLTIWVTFFSYGIMTTFGAVPKVLVPEQFLSFFLCWYIIFDAPFIFLFQKEKTSKKNIVANGSDILDLKRVTWWSHATCLNKADEFVGEKGRVVFKQGIKANILFLVFFVVQIAILSPILYTMGSVLFLNLSVDPPSLMMFTKVVASFFFFGPLIFVFMSLGMVLSRRMVLYKNCISFPLATLSDKPLFTMLLPKSSALLDFEDVVSYRIKKKKYEKSNEFYISAINLTMNNGDYYVFEPSVSLSFEQILIDTIGEEKRVK